MKQDQLAALLANAVSNIRANEGRTKQQLASEIANQAKWKLEIDELANAMRDVTHVLVETAFPGAWCDAGFVIGEHTDTNSTVCRAASIRVSGSAIPGTIGADFTHLKWGSDPYSGMRAKDFEIVRRHDVLYLIDTDGCKYDADHLERYVKWFTIVLAHNQRSLAEWKVKHGR